MFIKIPYKGSTKIDKISRGNNNSKNVSSGRTSTQAIVYSFPL